MTTLMGLDLAGRRVLVAGGGPVAARRVRSLLQDGAQVLLVSPVLCPDLETVVAAAPAGLTLRRRPVAQVDLEGVWLVHTATGEPAADEQVCRWAHQRQVFCVDASGGRYSEAAGRTPQDRHALGSARTAAVTRSGDVLVGVVSVGDPDPGRSRDVRDAVARLLDAGALPVRRRRPGPGRVVLVGGGPGATDLLTLRGRQALAEADVVVADRLGPVDVLAELPPEVEVVDVGKVPGRHAVPQDRINALLVERARRGQIVVRLKGGDPFVLGRGGEEVAACRAAGVPVEVVPGVTSAVAVPAAGGIPVTHRGAARGFAVLSGHSAPTVPAAATAPTDGAVPDGALAAALVEAQVTVVVLMAAARLQELSRSLLAHGADPATPVAVVENGCTPKERTRRVDLAGLADLVGIASPAVVVVGAVAADGLLGPLPEPAAVRMAP